MTLVSTKHLARRYTVDGKTLWAVRGVSLEISRGETLALVGESGCGKTTYGRCLLRLVEPSEGEVFFDGRNVTKLSGGRLRSLRRRMQIVFQDPNASLNPRMTVATALREPLKVHGLEREVDTLLEQVGLPLHLASRYPHELSGGERQRVVIARALTVQPDFLVADEPVSNLDVSVRAQILNLLADLKEQMSLTYLLISHDLQVVRSVSDRIAVMYLGKIVEVGPTAALSEKPQHPYTQALWASVPSGRRRVTVPRGELPSALDPPAGCSFHPRCPIAEERCSREEPQLTGESHRVACHLVS